MKKKRMSNKTFRRITIPVMAVVLAALIVGNVAAYSYRGLISTHFNHDTFKIVETGEDVDSNYFPCDFSSEEELNEHQWSGRSEYRERGPRAFGKQRRSAAE